MTVRKYKFYTLEDRKTIEDMLKNEKTQIEISEKLHRSISSIRSEIRRCGGVKNYKAEEANIFKPFRSRFQDNNFTQRIECLEMQVEILTDTIKEIMKNAHKMH